MARPNTIDERSSCDEAMEERHNREVVYGYEVRVVGWRTGVVGR